MNRATREKFPESAEPIIASVIDLSFVPPFYWVAANMELDRAYREAASALPPDADPKEYVVILPDWTGSATRKHRASERDGVSAVVIGGDSNIVGVGGEARGVVGVLERLRVRAGRQSVARVVSILHFSVWENHKIWYENVVICTMLRAGRSPRREHI